MNAKRMEEVRLAPVAVRGGSRQAGLIHSATNMIINATPVMTIDLRLDSFGNSSETMIVEIVMSEKDAEKTPSA